MTVTGTALQVRPYVERDEEQVLQVLRAALGEGPTGDRSSRFFRWKHADNPFGRSFLMVAEADGRVVGLRAFMRWRFKTGSSTTEAVRAVDTATHPAYQRMGIFSKLTRAALESIRDEVDLIFNTPNEKSLPGYLKMGWQVVGKVPVCVRVRRPIALLTHLRARPAPPPISVSGDPAGDVLGPRSSLASLLEAAAAPTQRLTTPKDLDFLRWRYGAGSSLDYRAFTHSHGGNEEGLVIFRVKRRGALWETAIAELITRPGDRGAARKLLGEVVRAAPVHHLTLVDGAEMPMGARPAFLRSPSPMTLVVNPFHDGIRPDPTRSASWALTLGDVEVF